MSGEEISVEIGEVVGGDHDGTDLADAVSAELSKLRAPRPGTPARETLTTAERIARAVHDELVKHGAGR